MAKLLNHIIVPAADGKVRALPVGTFTDFVNAFARTARNQMVGVGMHVADGKVTVMSLQAMSFMGHGLMRVNAKNLLNMAMGV